MIAQEAAQIFDALIAIVSVIISFGFLIWLVVDFFRHRREMRALDERFEESLRKLDEQQARLRSAKERGDLR